MHEPLGEQLLFQQLGGELGKRRARLPLRQRLEDHLGGRRIAALPFGPRLVLPAALGLHFFVAFFVVRLQLGETAARLRVDGARLALAGAVLRIFAVGRRRVRHHRLDDQLLRHSPFGQREGPVGRDGDDLAILLALGHGREPLAHGDFRILPDVREQVVLEGELGDFLEVKRLAGAAQHFHRSFRKGHVVLRRVPAGLIGSFPLAARKKSRKPIELRAYCQRT